MKKKILIAANSFKECADSVTVSKYFAEQLSKDPRVNLILKPISDGGDGFLNVCRLQYKLEILKYRISTPYDESKFTCRAGYDRKNKIIYIESADVLGLKLIPKAKRHPLLLSSKGMGELLNSIAKDIHSKQISVKKVVVGVGGTGTNDLGIGMCSALGLKLFDKNGAELKTVPKNFQAASSLLWADAGLPFNLEIILDVKNPLLGKRGATHIFGRQKGLTANEVLYVEKGFKKMLNILNYNRLRDIPNEISGAGGGLAAGFILFLNALTKASEDFLLNDLGLGKIKTPDYVILTEGSFDKQSLMGKATGSLMQYFSKSGSRIILCAGKVEKSVRKFFPLNTEVIELVKYFKSERDSIKNFRKGIKLASKEILRITTN